MYESVHDQFHTDWHRANLNLLYMDTNFFTIFVRTINEALKHFEEVFDFSELDPSTSCFVYATRRLKVK